MPGRNYPLKRVVRVSPVGDLRYYPLPMDWNTLLLWMAAPSCVISLSVAMRSSPKLKGWIFICLLIMGTGAVCYFVWPLIAGYLVGSMWAMLMVTPALLQRSAGKYSLSQKYDRAARYAAVAGVLHPFDGAPQQAAFLHGLALAERGEIDRAIAVLENLENTAHLRIARTAGIHARRLRGDWPAVIDWIRMISSSVPAARSWR